LGERAHASRFPRKQKWFVPLFDAKPSLSELCEYAPTGDEQAELVLWFVRLVDWLRPEAGGSAAARLKFLRAQFAQHPEWKQNVGNSLSALVRSADVEQLLAYGGIPKDFHFWGALIEWFSLRALPTACLTNDADQIVRLAFRESDLAWLRGRDLAALLREVLNPELFPAIEASLVGALVGLSHEITAQAHAPSIRSLAQSERSPFRGLHDSVVAFVSAPADARAADAVRGRARQCAKVLDSHREELLGRGADLNTTFQLARLRLQLERLMLLASLGSSPDDRVVGSAAVELIAAATRRRSGRAFLARSTDLVVQNLVDTAGTVGRNYLEKQSSVRVAFLAGAGGGALMAVATMIKFFLAARHLPAFYEGIVFSLNYASVFSVAYLMHYTIATKLPAHTATALAQSVEPIGGHRERLARFWVVWRATLRMQFAGLLGNIVVAAPLAYVFGYGFARIVGHAYLTPEKAHSVLRAQSVFGPSVLYAALAGVFLWASSLIGAAADNWTRVTRLVDRLATNVTVLRRFSREHARRRAEVIVARVGGLSSNIALGFMLGAIPATFAIASLPVEIRHVTVSSSSVALAFANGGVNRSEVVLAVVGVVAIGGVNVAVSFLLALWLALRSASARRGTDSSYVLVRAGILRWLKGKAPTPRAVLPVVTVPKAEPVT
jgi:site-specific recombinase